MKPAGVRVRTVTRASLGSTVRRAVAGTLVAAAAGVVVGSVGLAGRGAASGAPALALDATGPLFSATQLDPGSTTVRCVTLSWTQAATDSAALYFYGSASGTLASYLTVTVESGSGGSYAGCAGFAGTPLYNGPLDQFSAMHGDATTALALPGTGVGDGSRTFRFTTTVLDDNAAQGATAAASFSWGAEPNLPGGGGTPTTPVTVPVTPTGTATPTATPTPTPSISPTAARQPSPTSTPPTATSDPGSGGSGTDSVPTTDGSMLPTDTGTPGATAAPDPSASAGGPSVTPDESPTRSESALPSPGATTPGTGAPSAPGSGRISGSGQDSKSVGAVIGAAAAHAWHAVGTAARVVVQDAPAAMRGGAFGLGTFPFLLLFLLLQRHIDHRDPKLALAPAHADAYLDFDPPTEDGS